MLLLVVLVACGQPAPSANGPSDAVFPHSQAFIDNHGVAWRQSGTCTQCHSVYGEEPSAGPSCVECHAAYPHRDGMAHGSMHGALWQSDPTACVKCHGEEGDRQPAEAPVGQCTGCHATYPHPSTWRAPTSHGAAVLAHGGTQSCQGCHGAQLTLCSTCHAQYPHPSDWIDPSAHGAAFEAAGAQSCDGCHAEPDPLASGAVGSAGGVPACSQCHAVFPHPADWTPTGHIPVVQAQGAKSCEGCHAPGSLVGPRIPNNCASACHGEGL